MPTSRFHLVCNAYAAQWVNSMWLTLIGAPTYAELINVSTRWPTNASALRGSVLGSEGHAELVWSATNSFWSSGIASPVRFTRTLTHCKTSAYVQMILCTEMVGVNRSARPTKYSASKSIDAFACQGLPRWITSASCVIHRTNPHSASNQTYRLAHLVWGYLLTGLVYDANQSPTPFLRMATVWCALLILNWSLVFVSAQPTRNCKMGNAETSASLVNLLITMDSAMCAP